MQSYRGLKQHHFDNEDRKEKGISKDSNLERLNKHYQFISDTDMDDFYQGITDLISEYNECQRKRRKPDRMYKSIKEFIDKKQSRKNVNVNFNGLEFMMVSKLGDMDSWNDIVGEFREHNVSESDTLACLNEAFRRYGEWFNEEFQEYGIAMVEGDTNLDETGAPHMHSRLVLSRPNSGHPPLPDTNISNAIQDWYIDSNDIERENGKAPKVKRQEVLSDFRDYTDNALMRFCSHELQTLAYANNFTFSPFTMERKTAKDRHLTVGLSHDEYVRRKVAEDKIRKDIKKKKEELKQLDGEKEQLKKDKESLEVAQVEYKRKLSSVSDKEESIKKREQALDDREAKFNKRELMLDQQRQVLLEEKIRKYRNEAREYKDKLDEEDKRYKDKLEIEFINYKRTFDKKNQEIEKTLRVFIDETKNIYDRVLGYVKRYLPKIYRQIQPDIKNLNSMDTTIYKESKNKAYSQVAMDSCIDGIYAEKRKSKPKAQPKEPTWFSDSYVEPVVSDDEDGFDF